MEKEPGLKIVDAFDLEPEVRSLLMPQELTESRDGRRHQLPRYFYEIPSHEAARDVRLSAHFGLNELLLVDLKEAVRTIGKDPYFVIPADAQAARSAMNTGVPLNGTRQTGLSLAIDTLAAKLAGVSGPTKVARAPLLRRIFSTKETRT